MYTEIYIRKYIKFYKHINSNIKDEVKVKLLNNPQVQ